MRPLVSTRATLNRSCASWRSRSRRRRLMSHAEHHGGQAFEQEQPLPSGEAAEAVQLQQRAGDRPSDEAGDSGRCHEEGDGAGALPRGKPEGEIQQHARKEPGFRHAEQEPHDVEHGGALHKHHGSRHEAPRDHDAGNPPARSHPVKNEITRHLEQDVPDEEDTCPKPVHRVAETKVLIHLKRREADVDAVQVGDDIKEEHERDDTPANPCKGTSADVIGELLCVQDGGWRLSACHGRERDARIILVGHPQQEEPCVPDYSSD